MCEVHLYMSHLKSLDPAETDRLWDLRVVSLSPSLLRKSKIIFIIISQSKVGACAPCVDQLL